MKKIKSQLNLEHKWKRRMNVAVTPKKFAKGHNKNLLFSQHVKNNANQW